MSIIAETMKLLGNSAYGGTIMNKEKHSKIKYVKGERNASHYINDSKFKSLSKMSDDVYEIQSFKK